MQNYKIGLVPGPVEVPYKIRSAWVEEYGSADIENEFFELYALNQGLLRVLLKTHNDIVITSGEAMSILWASLKCTLKEGEKLLSVSSGLFGEGFAEMGRALGFESELVSFDYDDVPEPDKVYESVKKFRPKVITAVHCETPSGTINPYLKEIGEIAHKFDALFIVDFVSSAGGVPLNVDECNIDIGLLGSQKVLSMPSSLSITSISERAWEIIEQINYSGYEAFLPWREVPEKKFTPYTHDWYSMKALNYSLTSIFDEGLQNSWERHKESSEVCREMGREIGLKLFPKKDSFSSPTVTAFYVPEKWSWKEFDDSLRSRGVVVGGNYGKLSGKVFRIGHMGSQAQTYKIKEAMTIISEILH